jgi:hypothetical protein
MIGLMDNEPGSDWFRTDQRPKAVTVCCDAAAEGPWYALKAEAMARERLSLQRLSGVCIDDNAMMRLSLGYRGRRFEMVVNVKVDLKVELVMVDDVVEVRVCRPLRIDSKGQWVRDKGATTATATEPI